MPRRLPTLTRYDAGPGYVSHSMTLNGQLVSLIERRPGGIPTTTVVEGELAKLRIHRCPSCNARPKRKDPAPRPVVEPDAEGSTP